MSYKVHVLSSWNLNVPLFLKLFASLVFATIYVADRPAIYTCVSAWSVRNPKIGYPSRTPIAHCYNPDEVFVREEVILGRAKRSAPSGAALSPLFIAQDKRDHSLRLPEAGSVLDDVAISLSALSATCLPREGRASVAHVAHCLALVAVARIAVRMSRFFGVWRVLNV